MTADRTARRTSPLGHRAADLAAASSPAVTLAEIPFRPMVNLRVPPGTARAAEVETALGTELPGPLRVSAAGDTAVLWLGPDEWLLVGPDGAAPPTLPAASVIDVSANRTTVAVRGPRARDVLAKGVALDLHPRAFGPGTCAATQLARTELILWQTGESAYELLVRCSFAGYLADWLIDASAEWAG